MWAARHDDDDDDVAVNESELIYLQISITTAYTNDSINSNTNSSIEY